MKGSPSNTYSIKVTNARNVAGRCVWPGVYEVPRDLDEQIAHTLLIARCATKVLPERETK